MKYILKLLEFLATCETEDLLENNHKKIEEPQINTISNMQIN